ncbi:MAG: glycoside hydrolase family 99-like domain-containing protein, partial [Paramuribaculum sp.]|nr:glycoside hydrolase family 99-like domain-containing protein [Paramuribaculum sp.]
PYTINYKSYSNDLIKLFKPDEGVYPSIDPNFDHSPRSGTRGTILTDSTPERWGKLCEKVFKKTDFRSHEENLIFIKAWNEWGEGNYLEPDIKYGMGYLEQLKKAIEEL